MKAAYDSSERTIANACYIINTPAFRKLKMLIYLPLKTCEDYRDLWNFLHDQNSNLPNATGRTSSTVKTEGGTNYETLNAAWNECSGEDTNPFVETGTAFSAMP